MTDKEYQQKYQKEYYQKNKERIRARHEKYNIENKEKLKEKRKEFDLLNKEQIKAYRKEYYQTLSKEKKKDRDLKSKYGIDVARYEEMLKEQENKCACCGVSLEELSEKYPNSFHKALVVDHDHETGKVRGLLCSSCNTLIGYLEKRKELIPKAYDYIEKHK